MNNTVTRIGAGAGVTDYINNEKMKNSQLCVGGLA